MVDTSSNERFVDYCASYWHKQYDFWYFQLSGRVCPVHLFKRHVMAKKAVCATRPLPTTACDAVEPVVAACRRCTHCSGWWWAWLTVWRKVILKASASNSLPFIFITLSHENNYRRGVNKLGYFWLFHILSNLVMYRRFDCKCAIRVWKWCIIRSDFVFL
jgi:hypothetical protein